MFSDIKESYFGKPLASYSLMMKNNQTIPKNETVVEESPILIKTDFTCKLAFGRISILIADTVSQCNKMCAKNFACVQFEFAKG